MFERTVPVFVAVSNQSRRRLNSIFSHASRFYNSNIGVSTLPFVENEVLKHYAPGSVERGLVKDAWKTQKNMAPVEVPCIVGGKRVLTGDVFEQRMPSNHGHVLAKVHQATPEVIIKAIEAANNAKYDWEHMDVKDRHAIFTKASWILATEYRYKMMAATMYGTGKNTWQAEIDCAAELIDFLRFGPKMVEEMYNKQILLHDPGIYNSLECRPLEGYVTAISPFNFAAIGGNLPATPAMVGNTVLWKPSSLSILSNYYTYLILEKAGLPPGVINFLPSTGSDFSKYAISHRDFSGINFTGSTQVFRTIWRNIANNLHNYKTYPRIVGETGGKNFVVVHSSADILTVIYCIIRGAFEYSGQKCSATSRAYICESLWPEIKEGLCEIVKQIKLGQPDEFDVFMSAVIDKNAFNKISNYINEAENDSSCEILIGGKCDDSFGYFIEPTIIVTTDPYALTMREEIFGPVLTIYVYDDDKYEETLKLVDNTSDYALTGSIFAHDRKAIITATDILRNAAGNFYINDKSTGSVVGQQPFGGARASGTNDKAGFNTIFSRFCSIRSIKENFVNINDWRYPHMDME